MRREWHAYLQELQTMQWQQLQQQLVTDTEKICFWLNVYNAFIQIQLLQNPAAYKNRNSFFFKKSILLAGKLFSFNDIENGILRRSKPIWFLGYITNPFASKWEKQLRVANPDYRIHFALNCGAASCPPILCFTAEKLPEQLALATTHFLSQHTQYHAENNTVYVSKLLSWYRGDFGGLSGVKKLLLQHQLIPAVPVHIQFTKYDWTLQLQHYLAE